MEKKSTKLTKEELDYEMNCLARRCYNLNEEIDGLRSELYSLLKRMKELLKENESEFWQNEWDRAHLFQFEELDPDYGDDDYYDKDEEED